MGSKSQRKKFAMSSRNGPQKSASPDVKKSPKRVSGNYESHFIDHSDVRDANSPDSGTSSQSSSELISAMENITISFPPKCVTPVGLTSIPPEGWVSFTFEIHQNNVGWMIGGKGSFISKVREKSGCHVQVIRHPHVRHLKLCVIYGPSLDHVEKAKLMIRERFPRSRFPRFKMDEYQEEIPIGVVPGEVVVPNIVPQHLTLPVGVSFHVVVSALSTPENIFLQQVTHPSFHHLNVLGTVMDSIYGEGSAEEPPPLMQPLTYGILCAAEWDGHWFRCQIVEVYENSDEIAVLDLDYGGYYTVKTNTCRQIRADLLNYPFQAAEAHLANIMPNDGVAYPKEALSAAEDLLMGTVLTATVIGFNTSDGKPCVELHVESPEGPVHLNQEMVCRGLARWVE
ncbi:unnamed protein product [Cyprideis torosa]|uniref:Uncharacterized protein n=1 Tax=Cyprideis torosa TaxID=163714 RepID=A0A7R8W6K9_9CRUS|nr:unnamed protein product [Cyprideis torosa]CAG0886631.1 unnamed protein product [Cyprideis torosa]